MVIILARWIKRKKFILNDSFKSLITWDFLHLERVFLGLGLNEGTFRGNGN